MTDLMSNWHIRNNDLFKDRVPEAAARQLACVLAWLTECELATLEQLESLKSASKYAVNRHRSICNDAVTHCHQLNVPPIGLSGRPCPRLKERLEEFNKPKETPT